MGRRLGPLPPGEWTEEQLAVLVATSPTDEPATGSWYQTLVRHPKLHARWVAFGARLLVAGRLPDRARELLVLRTAWLTGAEYYWEPHVRLAHDAGISVDEVEGVVRGPTWPGWAGLDRALVASADELVGDHVVGDATWEQLAAELDEQQLIEVPFLVGHYVMVADVMRSLGVELEPGQAGFELR